jgi:hypothetical protein
MFGKKTLHRPFTLKKLKGTRAMSVPSLLDLKFLCSAKLFGTAHPRTRAAVPDPHYFGKLNPEPDPHLSEKLD